MFRRTAKRYLISSADDPRLQSRNGDMEDGAAFSLMAAPLMDHESLVGVAEVINRLDGKEFDEDDLSLLVSICETAASALHNASLLAGRAQSRNSGDTGYCQP